MSRSVTEVRRELDLPIGARSILPLRDFLQRAIADAGLSQETLRDVTVAIDAAATGLLSHGAEVRKGHLTVGVEVNETRLLITVQDHTAGAELSANPTEDLVHLACRPRAELGLSVLRRVMDEISYQYARGFVNELRLIKFL